MSASVANNFRQRLQLPTPQSHLAPTASAGASLIPLHDMDLEAWGHLVLPVGAEPRRHPASLATVVKKTARRASPPLSSCGQSAVASYKVVHTCCREAARGVAAATAGISHPWRKPQQP
ncbi:hypothetical protein JDV02_001240 [Purpureocillium takamizusanense]|uniref:Uncharacterized protein n=1 Tax=Purpureocillium takamizusanense TaxID=2060973 RepID=A0A9Q8V7M9_9HYPO|nr:uncharacterized protein JDV02_001240 [Purpureocillium takamizusanense]UNI14631.1 hypothetical protein JDV02_001240 [Purpureocillium takamizusanense]